MITLVVMMVHADGGYEVMAVVNGDGNDQLRRIMIRTIVHPPCFVEILSNIKLLQRLILTQTFTKRNRIRFKSCDIKELSTHNPEVYLEILRNCN